MHPRTLPLLITILLVSATAYAQGIVTPRRHQSAPPADAAPTTTSSQAPTNPLPSALPVAAIKINARIEGRVATVRVEHWFRNETDETLEGTYYFPVPETATLVEFAVYDGNERRVGRVKEKEEARTAYRAAAAQGEDPAILEMTKRGWFQSHIYPIAPHADKRIEIIYSQFLTDKDGVVSLDYPLGRGYKKLNLPVARVEINIDLRAEAEIKNVYSPTHPLDIRYDGDRHVTADTTTAGGGDAENFQLLYSLSDTEIGATLITYREKDKDGYFLLMLSPKINFERKRISAKDVLFVVDISGSMSGEKLRQAKEAIRYGLTQTLSEDDRFNIIAFESAIHPMAKNLIEASRANIDRALRFVDKLDSDGGTNINDSLVAALRMFSADNRLHNLVFLTDGQPTDSVTTPEGIAANVQAANQARVRLFAFGVGNDVNRLLLEKLAAANRGASSDIADQSQLASRLSTFFAKVSQPVLSELRVDFGPVLADRLHPAELPDLYTRSQIRIFGRYRNAEDLRDVSVRLTGMMNGQSQQFDFSGLHFPLATTERDTLPKLWATERVQALLAEIRVTGERAELKQEIIDLAREFNLVTPYTSMYVPTTAELQREKEEQQALRVANVSGNVVTVSGSFEPIQKETGAKETTITAKQIDNLSIIARNALELLKTLPGAEAPNAREAGQQSVSVNGSAGADKQYHVNGLRGEMNNVSIDGSRVVDIGSNKGTITTANVDAVQEVKVQSGNYGAAPGSGSGQPASAAPGTVVDANGAVVANATVTIRDENTRSTRTVTTDDSGHYSVAGLPPGKYQVEVQAPGFQTTTVSNVTVQPGQTAATSVQLNTASATETVTVTAMAPALQTETESLSSTLELNVIKSLPTLAPAQSLARLAAGTSLINNEALSRRSPEDQACAFGLSINGGQPQATAFTLNGFANDIDGRPVVAVKNLDAVQMLQVMQTRNTGDVSANTSAVNLVSRAGSNDYHGSVFDYRLDSRLGALAPLERRSGLANPPKEMSDFFGGTIGGPIRRDRSFFFVSFAGEMGTAQRFIDSTAAMLTPTARGLDELRRAFPSSAAVQDLLARGPLTILSGQPRMQRTLTQMVLGTPIEFGELSRILSAPARRFEGGSRFDFVLSKRDNLQMSYWHSARDEANIAGRAAAGYASDASGQGQLGGLQWTRVWSPVTTNEVNFAINRARLTQEPNESIVGAASASPSTAGSLYPGVSIGPRGLDYGLSPYSQTGLDSTAYIISETLVHISGQHSFKFGGQLRIRRTRFEGLPGTGGHYSFASFEDFVLGQPAALAVTIGDPPTPFSEINTHFFAEDSMRVRRDLNLTVGVSYAIAGQPYNQLVDRIRRREADPSRALFDQSQSAASILHHIPVDANNISPRLGFAYTPRLRLFGKNLSGNEEMVIRGGVSLAYDQTAYRPLAEATAAAPNVLAAVLTPAASTLPPFPVVPDARGLRALLGSSLSAYARTELARDYRTPSLVSWHLETARSFADELMISLGYVGTRGANLIRAIDGNSADSTEGPRRIYESAGHSIYHSLQARADMRLSQRLNASVAYTFAKLIDDVPENAALLAGVGSIGPDNQPSIQDFAQNVNDATHGERALSSLDRRHALTASFVYDLPQRRGQSGVMDKLLNGWKASSIIEVASGRPFTPLQFFGNSPMMTALFAAGFTDRFGALRPFMSNPGASVDAVAFTNAANRYLRLFLNADGSPFISATGYIIADARGFHAGQPQSARFIYNDSVVEQAARARGLAPDAFGKTFAAGRAFGDAGRNSLISPRLANVNFAVFKNTRLTEHVSLQLRSEFFNLFNHPSRGRPNAVIENAGGYGFADAGEVNAAPRRVRLALKLMF